MGKVYAPPVETGTPPKFDYKKESFLVYQKRQEEYIKGVQDWARNNGNGQMAGEIVSFPFADGYAMYVVMSLKPVTLIHLPVGDSWQYPYVERLTAKDIADKVRQSRSAAKLFGRAAS